MFEKKAPILYLTRTHASLYDGVQLQHAPFVATWNGKDVLGLLKLMQQQTKETEWNVLLGNDFCYLLTLSLTKEQANAAFIQEELAGRIPEEITPENYAWNIIPTTAHQPTVIVQTFVVPVSLLQALKTVGKDLHLSVQSMTALSLVLAAETRAFPNPHITYWYDREQLCLVSYQGAVYHCESFSEITDTQVRQVLQVAQSCISQPITTLVTNGDLSATMVPTLFPHAQITKHAFQPIAWLVEQRGNGEHLLSLQPGSYHPAPQIVISPAVTPQKQSASSAPPSSSKRPFVLLGVLIVLLLFTVWYVYTSV